MADLSLLPVFMVGLLGSAHCIGMCGGIVAALSAAAPPAQPVAVVPLGRIGARQQAGALDAALRVIAYNAGRIGSYGMAGAIVGGIAGSARTFAAVAPLQIGGYWAANLMLVVLGLYLMDAWRVLARLEAAGGVVWRRLQPLMKHLLPMDSVPKALAMGALWGWLPCGMVYSMLLTALATGSARAGAIVMMVFGLGTIPALLGLGMLGARLRTWARYKPVRIAGGLVVLAFGILGMVRAANGLSLGWLDSICLSPPAAGSHR